MARSLADMPVSERDIVEGTIRYRQFGDWVAIFHHSSSSDAFIIDVIGFRPPVVLSKSEEFSGMLDKVAKLRGVLGI